MPIQEVAGDLFEPERTSPGPIYFYSHLKNDYGCFSNFSPHGVDLDGLWWPTVEHYFQGQKFPATPHLEAIRQASNPKTAKSLGRSRRFPLRSDWEAVKDEIMRRAVLRKFELHAGIREVLLSTGEAELIENSPSDYYWGCGKDGSGKNMLGKILMRSARDAAGSRDLKGSAPRLSLAAEGEAKV